MEHINDFFISHNSADREQATALYDLLRSVNPDWRIFLDCSDEKPLESHSEWRARMILEVEHSKHLIFLASSIEYLKEGNGWLYEEVSHFQALKATRNARNSGERNLSYFGILFGALDFEKDLFCDLERGGEYRRIYSLQEHLLLNSNETITTAAERIKGKVMNLATSGDRETVTELLDKTRAFAMERKTMDSMFSMDAICDALLPGLADRNHRHADFEGLCEGLMHTHVALLGSEGGAGKTSILTKLFYRFLEDASPDSGITGMVPLYIDAKTLLAENYLILRYLAKNLYGEYTAMTDRTTGEIIGKLNREFSKKTDAPEYLLLIDGYNEIPEQSLAIFDRELGEYLSGGRYRNVRIVIAGRSLGEVISGDDFYRLNLEKLEWQTASEYLTEHRSYHKTISPSLKKILSIPMYLKMYAETSADARIRNKGDLLLQFVNWQKKKEQDAATDDVQTARYTIFLDYLLPLIAHRMVMTETTVSAYVISEDALLDICRELIQLLSGDEYQEFYGREFRNLYRQSGIEDLKKFDLLDLSLDYLVDTCKLLNRVSEGQFEFIHQIYRDFFCARFIEADIRRATARKQAPTSFGNLPMNHRLKDISGFVTELLEEGRPYLDRERGLWDYSCNQTSYLTALLQIARDTEQKNCPTYIANLVSMLRVARAQDLSGCDFSHLDLRESALRFCVFSRFDALGVHASSFEGARINRENLLCENHSTDMKAVCVNETMIASMDDMGNLHLWNREPHPIFPIKILTGVNYPVSRMLFSQNGTCIYAMSTHEILEIPLPEEFYSVAKPKVLYQTTKRLRNLTMDDAGAISFTTAFNAFNPKPISNPNAPDVRNFHGINSAAAVNEEGNQLAFGYVTGYTGVKLYYRNSETDGWTEQKFGYSLYLEQYILELERALKQCKLYYLFPDDQRVGNGKHHTRRTYFVYLQHQKESWQYGYEKVPGMILEQILKYLNQVSVTLYSNQKQMLEVLAEKYTRLFLELKRENPFLLELAAKTIRRLEYHRDGKTLLISCYGTRMPKGAAEPIYDSYVFEMDTQTFAMKKLEYHSGGCPLEAQYDGDDVVMIRNHRIYIRGGNGNPNCYLTSIPKSVQYVLPALDDQSFFLLEHSFIYQFDKTLQCIKSMPNYLRGEKYLLACDEEGHGYLVSAEDFSATRKKEWNITAFDLTNGINVKLPNRLTGMKWGMASCILGKTGIKINGNLVGAFLDSIKADELPLATRLFICGCDFSGIETDMEEKDLEILRRYGGTVDGAGQIMPRICLESENFIPSQIPFLPPDESELPAAPYAFHRGAHLEKSNLYPQAPGESWMEASRTWNLIHWGSFSKNGLEESDYGILEWMNRLGLVSRKMVVDLMDAGLIEKPAKYQYEPEKVGTRMSKTIHGAYRLSDRHFFFRQGVHKNLPIYSPSVYGGRLMMLTTEEEQSALTDCHEVNIVEARLTLARNQWFCQTIREYQEQVTRYELHTVFDAQSHFFARARVDGYIKLGDQAFFAEIFRIPASEEVEKMQRKVNRLCQLATHYRYLHRALDKNTLIGYCRQFIPEPLTKPPILVFFCESLTHCEEIHEATKMISPHIRKIFTYDVLFNLGKERETGCYLEFIEDGVYGVKLEDLIGT